MEGIVVIFFIIAIVVIGGLAIYYDIKEEKQRWKTWNSIKKGDIFLSITRHESPFIPTEITPIVIVDIKDNWILFRWPDDSLSNCPYESFFRFWGFVSLEAYNENNSIKYHYEPEVKTKTTGDLFLK